MSSSGSDVESVELPPELSKLLDHVDSRPESFVHGDVEIGAAALSAAKYLFDRGEDASHGLCLVCPPIS